MSERKFEQSMNPRERIEQELQELKDAKDASERSKAVEVESEEGELEISHYKKLFSYLDGEKIVVDKEKIEKFRNTEDHIERLELLCHMNTAEAVAALKEGVYTEGARRYLADRLDFYQKLFQGKAIRRYQTEKWDSEKGEYIEITKEESIDANDVTPETVRSGLFRDMLFASMMGTPEMGVYKIANRKCKDRELSTEHMICLKGYRSGIIEPGPNGSIGYGYPFLHKLYGEARKFIEQRATEEEKRGGEQYLEHRAVLLASEWLAEAMNYNDPYRSQRSSYASGIEEAVAWARLGDEGVKARLRGMRQKIRDSDLHNIERFIGKSGPNKYAKEKKGLEDDIAALTDYLSDKKDSDAWYWVVERDGEEEKVYGKEAAKLMLIEKNKSGIERQKKWFTREKKRLERKFEKEKAQIEQRELPDKERELQLINLQERFDTQIASLETGHQQRIEYFQNRTTEQLLADIKKRQEVVEERYEKHKSLAQKALDLHFAVNHDPEYEDENGDWVHDKNTLGIVDWINYAPFGTIKRCHKLLRQKWDIEKIEEYALADIIAGARGATQEDLKAIHQLVQEAQEQSWEARQKLEAMMKVGNIVSLFDYEISLQEVEELARKDFFGLTDALREYSLDEVKSFMDQNLDLYSVATARKITQKHGYDLDNAVIAEIASHDIEGLDGALNTFGLEDTQTLLRQNVLLSTAIAVRDNTEACGYELSIDQIATIAKGVEDVDDFISALKNLSLEQVEQLYSRGQQYENYEIVHSSLAEHSQDTSFVNSLKWTQKLARHDEWHKLSESLNTFSLEELEQISNADVTLSTALNIRQTLEELNFENSVDDVVRWSKVVHSWGSRSTIKNALKKFGRDNLLRMVEKEVPLQNALDIKYKIKRQNLNQFDTIEIIMAIAKHGDDAEVAFKTLEAGFTIEEITKYPFLISSLVARR